MEDPRQLKMAGRAGKRHSAAYHPTHSAHHGVSYRPIPACGEPSADGKITTLQHKNKAGTQPKSCTPAFTVSSPNHLSFDNLHSMSVIDSYEVNTLGKTAQVD